MSFIAVQVLRLLLQKVLEAHLYIFSSKLVNIS